jgi:hypothetical protein
MCSTLISNKNNHLKVENPITENGEVAELLIEYEMSYQIAY